MYNPKLLKPYLEAKYTNNIPFKNKELYMLCGCEDYNQKAAIRSLKSRYLKEFENKKYNETMELLKLKEILKQKKSNDYTTQEPKYQFHEQSEKPSTPQIQNGSEYHILGLIKKYPELPLFIYSKIFERVKPEYDRLEEERKKEYQKYKKVENDYFMNYSFYDLYMEIFESINSGKLDKEIKEYMKDVAQSVGTIHTYELEGVEFNQDFSDYAYFLEWVLRIISEIVDYFIYDFTFNELRYEILKYLLIKSNGSDTNLVSNIIDLRSKELIRADILRLYILGRKVYPNIELIEELYDEFDLRYSDKLDLAERGINYKGQYDDLFYIDKKGEKCHKSSLEDALIWEREGFEGLGRRGIFHLEHLTEDSKEPWIKIFKRAIKNKPDNYGIPEKEYDPPIPELENELNRLKGDST